MNILFLSEILYPHGSGGEQATFLWAKLLAQSGFSVKVITNKFEGESKTSEQKNLKIFRLPILKAHTGVKYFILGRIDILLSNFVRRLLAWADVVYIPRFWYSAIPIAKACGKPVITHLHGYILSCPLATLYDLYENKICDSNNFHCQHCILTYERVYGKNFFEALGSLSLNSVIWPSIRKLIKLSDALICVSHAQRDMIVSHNPSIARKCYVIHNPIPELPNLEINGSHMGYFGGPDPLKGFYVLCRALKHVKSEVTIHATKFKNNIKHVGRSRIVFHERLPEEEYWKVYKNIATVLVPSIWIETWCYVITEAILTGRVVISSDVGGISEQVQGCKGAFLFRIGDYKQLSELIDYIKGFKKETLIDLGLKNREVFLSNFSNERILNKFSALLAKVIEDGVKN